ncbi:MAG: acyl-CoA dehydrogenase family protein [Candidatus Electryonea clarkiae]|nr:acyl-CoA dehydrogenase family protein [Candidatus Electryonea clarkiae]
MYEMFDKTNHEYIEKARHIAETYLRPVAAELDREQTYPWEIIKRLQEAELMGVWIPKEYGGHDAGILNLCLVVEELSKVCGGVGVAFAVNALGSFPIILGGSEEQKKKYLPEIAQGRKLIAFGLSETDAGSDAGSLQTRAELDGDEYIINGAKKWNTNGGAAELYTIYASTRPDRGTRGISAIIVEKGTEGFEIGRLEDKMGIRAANVAELYFKDCRVPVENRLGLEGKGFGNAMMTLDRARPGVAAQAVGLAQGALDLAVKRAKVSQFGREPLAHQQAAQFKLADMATELEAARQLVYTTARALDAGVKNVGKHSAMCKLMATEVAMKITTAAIDFYEEWGMLTSEPIEKFMRDAKITQIYEGTNQVQRLVVARWLLKEYSA